ncbi:uncharacterized protein SAPINGB_P003651 [Magnusiomyces paraingens]|uniref:Diphosphomevalonate decarboxylase n=1 Tax=Magnusiomyces paraingens TaxID=2606893 RepID=A0A5E8BRB2_9ASCO|nr:uncharacterized protein SAPINGB_P003651 [Saprochaete ingens]VVT53591.1 unnamed protein product [Saprochaete ingens]
MAEIYSYTSTAPVNIATLKYWGKRNISLNLPTNSSVSVTLDQSDLRAITTAATSSSFTKDRLWLNGTEEDIDKSARLSTCVRELRKLRIEYEEKLTTEKKKIIPLSTYKLHIISENNFPTAAGLASSAAGFAALVSSVAGLYELPQTPEELSVLARQGSGSACRSLFGGYVAWDMGVKEDGSDSKAVSVAPREHWPDMRALILVANANKKDVSSTSGMQTTVATSSLFKERIETVVPERYEAMKKAIVDKDFESFAELTMRDSNQFHAVCLDSYPPIFYLNDTSRAAIRTVEEINKHAGKTVAAYTFDAGPNCVIYFLEENAEKVIGPIRSALANAEGWNSTEIAASLPEGFEQRWLEVLSAGVSRVYFTKVGDGPKKSDETLIGADGEPKK